MNAVTFKASWDNTNNHLQRTPSNSYNSSFLDKIKSTAWTLSLLPHISGKIMNRQLMPPISLQRKNDSKEHFQTFWFGPISEQNRELRKHFTVEKKSITTPDGANLDAFWIKRKDAREDIQTIIYFNGRSQLATAKRNNWLLEQSLKSDTPSNFVFFNYRGVGDSTGTFTATNDLIVDGASILQWVQKDLRVPSEQIHFYGYSLGGSVAVATKALDPEHLTGRLVNERSFASLEKIITTWFKWLGHCSVMIAYMITSEGYHINPAKEFPKLNGSSLVVYVPKDPIIRDGAALHETVPKDLSLCLDVKPEFKTKAMKQPHNAPLEWFTNADRITNFLFGSSKPKTSNFSLFTFFQKLLPVSFTG